MSNHPTCCKGCAHVEREHGGCMNNISWHSDNLTFKPFCHAPVLFEHPDGQGMIYFDHEKSRIVVENEITGKSVVLPIGTLGILALGGALVSLGIEILEAE